MPPGASSGQTTSEDQASSPLRRSRPVPAVEGGEEGGGVRSFKFNRAWLIIFTVTRIPGKLQVLWSVTDSARPEVGAWLIVPPGGTAAGRTPAAAAPTAAAGQVPKAPTMACPGASAQSPSREWVERLGRGRRAVPGMRHCLGRVRCDAGRAPRKRFQVDGRTRHGSLALRRRGKGRGQGGSEEGGRGGGQGGGGGRWAGKRLNRERMNPGPGQSSLSRRRQGLRVGLACGTASESFRDGAGRLDSDSDTGPIPLARDRADSPPRGGGPGTVCGADTSSPLIFFYRCSMLCTTRASPTRRSAVRTGVEQRAHAP